MGISGFELGRGDFHSSFLPGETVIFFGALDELRAAISLLASLSFPPLPTIAVTSLLIKKQDTRQQPGISFTNI